MRLGVDQAGEQMKPGGIVGGARRWQVLIGRDRDDPPAVDRDSGPALAAGGNDRAAGDRQVDFTVVTHFTPPAHPGKM